MDNLAKFPVSDRLSLCLRCVIVSENIELSIYRIRPTLEASTKDCGILILTLLEPGNDVMADRGFHIKEDMPDGVSLNIPPFLNGCTQRSLLMMKIKQEKSQP